MAIDVAMTGEVDRTKPHAELDGTDIDMRLSRYRELQIMPVMFTKHPLVDEGSYFAVNSAQTGIATAAAPTVFSATNPFLVIYNACDPSDDFALRYYLDYAMLLATATGTGATSIQFAITLDTGNRYTSGGTDLTSSVKSCGPTSMGSLARVYAGNLTASAATSSAKTIIGNRVMKTATAPAPTVNDQYVVRFGSPSVPDMASLAGTGTLSVNSLPPVIIGPNQSALIHLWFPAQSAASSFAPEMAWWER